MSWTMYIKINDGKEARNLSSSLLHLRDERHHCFEDRRDNVKIDIAISSFSLPHHETNSNFFKSSDTTKIDS